MKKTSFFLFIILCLVTFNAKADTGWTKIVISELRDIYYLDYKRIRKSNNNKFFWYLIDYGKEDKFGDNSVVIYAKGDCGTFRYKRLDIKFYSSSMGKGNLQDHIEKEGAWKYPKRESVMEDVLNAVCKY
tara:strand:- start:199 stop:588 length:390 start_codon:yes stop_codon:yes gene_type:complete